MLFKKPFLIFNAAILTLCISISHATLARGLPPQEQPEVRHNPQPSLSLPSHHEKRRVRVTQSHQEKLQSGHPRNTKTQLGEGSKPTASTAHATAKPSRLDRVQKSHQEKLQPGHPRDRATKPTAPANTNPSKPSQHRKVRLKQVK